MKISACLIVRDEASNIAACLESVRPHVDELIVVDTGSVDDTPAIARRYADKFEVFLDCNDTQGRIEDFAMARNRTLQLASGPVHFWLDGDDILENGAGLRDIVARWTKPNAIAMLPYAYQFDADGVCTLYQYRERLMRPLSGLEWRYPVHEGCLFTQSAAIDFETIRDDSVRLVHQTKKPKPREAGRNLRILSRYVEKNGEADVRALYYLGVEQAYAGELGSALMTLRRYVELAHWDEEKCLALLELSRLYLRIGDAQDAVRWAFRAMEVKSWPEPYWQLGRCYYALALASPREAGTFYRKAAHFIQLGHMLKPNDEVQSVLSQNPKDRYDINDILAVCLAQTGQLELAIEACKLGLQGLPTHERLKANLEAFMVELTRRSVAGGIEKLHAAGALNDGARVIMRETLSGNFSVSLLKDAPDESGSAAGLPEPTRGSGPNAEIAGLDSRATSPENGCLDIVLFVGHGLEPWDPDTLAKTGMGGSETMAWEMAKRLRKLGHRVRVFGHLPALPLYEGVEWYDQIAFHDLTADVLITSRRPEAVDDAFRNTFGCRILWVHDVHCGDSMTIARDMRIDRVLALSNWHRSVLMQVYPLLDPGKIIVTRNGVDLKRFEDVAENWRHAHDAIYSSSPDRGLETLLAIWPIVRKSIPDARLQVYYGFDNWEATARLTGDENSLKRAMHLRGIIERTEGVELFGRVDGKILAKAFRLAGVWAYPTDFTETSCITAMEATAAGCRIVTSPRAALAETVGTRGTMIDGSNGAYGSRGYIERFAAAIVVAMTGSTAPRATDDRKALQQYARDNFGLDELAKEWDKMIREVHFEVTELVVPRFRSVGS